MAINFSRLEDISRSLRYQYQTGRAFHTCFVYLGNKLICTGINNYRKHHPKHIFGEYSPTKENNENYVAGLHGEVDALIKLGLNDCSHLTFVNIRINNKNERAISKPCKNCWNVMQGVSFKKFWFFDGKDYIFVKH